MFELIWIFLTGIFGAVFGWKIIDVFMEIWIGEGRDISGGWSAAILVMFANSSILAMYAAFRLFGLL